MSSAHPPVPPLPYGIGNFGVLRRDRFFYVDKTRFIRPLEHERFAFFVRPRRFGKSLWLTMLDAYYNRAAAGAFETAFAGTDIGESPTADHNRYVVLYFDFSAFKQALASLEENFEEYCQLHVQDALRRNRDLFDDEARRAILGPRSVNGQLNALFLHVRDRGIPLCVLIDEYDNFANTILSEQGADAYDSCTHGGGFYRNFFATLKAGTTEAGCIERLFVTGVSPVTMDDVTSGFNIGANLSLRPQFNAMLGFTEDEVREVLRIYSEAGALTESPDQALDTMREWYDGYRFSEDAPADIYNTDMVLYYLKESIALGGPPRRLIDRNVRVDYGKLRHLLVVSRNAAEKQRLAHGGDVLNGNFDLLRRVVAEETAACELRDGFPLRELDRRENFLSLLHCFGLLSIRGSREGQPVLGIPNQTVRHLMYRILRDAYDEAGVLSVDLYEFGKLVHEMAYRGAWRPVFEHLAAAVARHAGIRDHMDGEKMAQGFLAAYLAATNYFLFHSEHELGDDYADIFLEPNAVAHPEAGHGYILELKYLKRSESAERVASLGREATAQLKRYLDDNTLRQRRPGVRFIGLALVYHGWELALAEAVEAAP